MSQKLKGQQSAIPVQGTNDSSIVSKLSMSNAGYFTDTFLKYFSPRSGKRTALINRGYYVRAKAIDHIFTTFFAYNSCKTQVVSLGAGFDSAYFRLYQQGRLTNCKFFEVVELAQFALTSMYLEDTQVDFPEVISRKMAVVSSVPILLDMLVGGPVELQQSIVDSQYYCAIGCDLNQLSVLEKSLKLCGINFSYPTLLLSECVLTYVHPKRVNILLCWSSKLFTNALFCSYEQINPDDGFGLVMQRHFTSLGSSLKNINAYPSRTSQEERYVSQGWTAAVSCDMNTFYCSLPAVERIRIDGLELFDEFEEWHLKCIHYSLLCAFNGTCGVLKEKLFPQVEDPAAIGLASASETKCLEPVLLQLHLSSTAPTRFSHGSVLLPSGEVLISGGYGQDRQDRPHSRLNSVLVLSQPDRQEWISKSVIITGNCPGRVMHHTLTFLPEMGSVLLYGGRQSPLCTNNHCYLLRYEKGRGEWCLVTLDPSSEHPEGRWRHTATSLALNGHDVVVVIGGRSSSNPAMDSCYSLDTKSWIFRRLSVSLPEGRHSHTAVAWKQSIVIAGGLTATAEPISSCLMLTYASEKWSLVKIEFNCPLPPRYSMAGCVAGDTLWLVGGVQPNGSSTGLLQLNLVKGMWRQFLIHYHPAILAFQQQCVSQYPILLHNHTCHLLEDHSQQHSSRILIIGGGGNCFSFGTYLNPPVEIVLPYGL